MRENALILASKKEFEAYKKANPPLPPSPELWGQIVADLGYRAGLDAGRDHLPYLPVWEGTVWEDVWKTGFIAGWRTGKNGL